MSFVLCRYLIRCVVFYVCMSFFIYFFMGFPFMCGLFLSLVRSLFRYFARSSVRYFFRSFVILSCMYRFRSCFMISVFICLVIPLFRQLCLSLCMYVRRCFFLYFSRPFVRSFFLYGCVPCVMSLVFCVFRSVLRSLFLQCVLPLCMYGFVCFGMSLFVMYFCRSVCISLCGSSLVLPVFIEWVRSLVRYFFLSLVRQFGLP